MEGGSSGWTWTVICASICRQWKIALPTIPGVIYVCNPNNPNRYNCKSGDLRGFIRAVSQRATVLVDEAYIDLTDEPQKNSMVNQIKAGLNVVVSRTFSNVYGMAGLRIGYGLGRPDVIARLEQSGCRFQIS